MLSTKDFDLLVFDFDGVLTDNTVFTDDIGHEFVRCSRSDGLAFDALRAVKIKSLIISSEKSSVVAARAKKLKVPVFYGVENKLEELSKYCMMHGVELKRTVFVGNDLNDFHVMRACGACICPSDAHPHVRDISTCVTASIGGAGVVREIVETILEIDILSSLYQKP